MEPIIYILGFITLSIIIYLSFTISRLILIIKIIFNKKVKIIKIYPSFFWPYNSCKHSDIIICNNNEIYLMKFFSYFRKKSKYLIQSNTRIDIIEYYPPNTKEYVETNFNYNYNHKMQMVNSLIFDTEIENVNTMLLFFPKNMDVVVRDNMNSITNGDNVYGAIIIKSLKGFTNYFKNSNNNKISKNDYQEVLKGIKKYKI